VALAAALTRCGLDVVTSYVGLEPSGQSERSGVFNSDGLPYNPFMWNGHINTSALLIGETREEGTEAGDTERGVTAEEALKSLQELWEAVSCQRGVEVDEQELKRIRSAEMNKVKALAYTLCDEECFPKRTDLHQTLELFFKSRALSTTVRHMSIFAATLANAGVNPYTGKRVVEREVTRHILTLLLLAGCGAQSGEFAFKVGVPIKSTGKGALLIVVPNMFGSCVLSSDVNEFDVSVLGKKFYCDLGAKFNLHVLEGSGKTVQKLDPQSYDFSSRRTVGEKFLHCAETADLAGLRSFANSGFDVDFADYDKRTAAHLAAMNGHVAILSYLDDRGAQLDVQDAWGQRPIDEAKKHKHHDVIQFFQERQPRRQVRLGMLAKGSSKGGGSDAEDAMSGFDSQDNPAADLSEYANYR